MNTRQDFSICRLCLSGSVNSFVLIDDVVREMLDVLFVKMNFSVTDSPLMCGDCAATVKGLVSFKSVYLESEKMITSFSINKNKVKVDIKDMYAHNSMTIIDDCAEICRFCMNKTEGNNFLTLDGLIKQNAFSYMLKMYMCELDLTIVKNPLICLDCWDNMESYSKLLQNCRDTEEKINAYQENEGVNGQKIILVNVFETYYEYTKKELYISLAEIKQEFGTEVEGVTDLLLYHNRETNDDELCTCDTKDTHCFRCHVMLKETASEAEDIKMETVQTEVDNRVLTIETEGLYNKDEVVLSHNSSGQRIIEDESKQELFECDACKFTTKYKKNLKRHLLLHKNSSEVTMYQCFSCNFKTKHKINLQKHMLVHKNSCDIPMYQCDSCEYQTKCKGNLNKHNLLIHKKSSEVQMHQCDYCEYKTNRKGNLKKHILVHRDFSEVQIFQCDSCEFQTKRKGSLNKHMLVHKDSSEVQMYQCDQCDYQSKQKGNLKTHISVHHDSAIVQMYHCYICDFETERESNLTKHLMGHEDSSETQMFQCDSCEYKTKRKDCLKNHMLVHKDSSEVQMYQCDICEYKSKYKSSIRNHSLKHKDFSVVETYRCDSCAYLTKIKGSLKLHLLTHMDSSEVQMHQCNRCEFKTKHKGVLKRHMLIHDDSPEVYQCDSCDFKTKHKNNLKQHKLLHRDSLNI